MRVTLLGVSGGIARGLRSVCIGVDDDLLIDAGTGANDLTLEAMAAIRHVFLTHAHLDHIACLPLLADAALERRAGPLVVHALPATLDALKTCVFNGRLWPDYTTRPTPEAPWVALEPIAVGQALHVGTRTLWPLPACHSVPALGYAVLGENGGFAYSGDTTLCEPFWDALKTLPEVRRVFLECTLRDDAGDIQAREWGHMTPRLWEAASALCPPGVETWVMHMEPGKEAATLAQLRARLAERAPRALWAGQVFED
jgi:ribonuclease BN (tRNA processing enzyme)